MAKAEDDSHRSVRRGVLTALLPGARFGESDGVAAIEDYNHRWVEAGSEQYFDTSRMGMRVRLWQWMQDSDKRVRVRLRWWPRSLVISVERADKWQARRSKIAAEGRIDRVLPPVLHVGPGKQDVATITHTAHVAARTAPKSRRGPFARLFRRP
jgi:hypothetical protein